MPQREHLRTQTESTISTPEQRFQFCYTLTLRSHTQRGDVEMWRCGDVEMWRCGDVEMWRCGDVARHHGTYITSVDPAVCVMI